MTFSLRGKFKKKKFPIAKSNGMLIIELNKIPHASQKNGIENKVVSVGFFNKSVKK
jgi:hypothetical protein